MDDLVEAGRRLRALDVEPSPPVSEIYGRSYRRRQRRARLLAGGASAVVVLAALGGVLAFTGTGSPSGPQKVVVAGGPAASEAAPAPPPLRAPAGKVSATLRLDHTTGGHTTSGHTTVVAGSTIRGVLTVYNNTAEPITINDPNSCTPAFLDNARLDAAAKRSKVLGVDEVCNDRRIPVGRPVSIRVTISTLYPTCATASEKPMPVSPKCQGDEPPPLPAGVYHTVGPSIGHGAHANSVVVRLKAPGH